MRTEITKLHQRLQTTFIYVTHDQTEAMTMGTRIVVMKDGVIQQVDNPQNLYDKPNNLFVAGFIGTPPMNFFDVHLTKDSTGCFALFGDNKVRIPESRSSAMPDDCWGKDAVMGVRPEEIDDNPDYVAAHPDAAIDAYVEVTEAMGSETYLYLMTSGKEGNVNARVDPHTLSRVGDNIKVAFAMENAHFFDKETEISLVDYDK
jgi:multiple sugar transport system ATP-binding protein